MLKFNLCFSARKEQRMQDRKYKVKKIKASVKDGIYLFICLFIAFSLVGRIDIRFKPTVQGVKADGGIQTIEMIKEVPTQDQRVVKLQTFLKAKNSPFAPYAGLIVEQADKFDIGWTKVVAISKIESDFGKKIPYNSHNAWGLGGSKLMRFASWEEGIKYVSWLLATSYKTNELHAIKAKYCPASDGCNPSWVFVVLQATTDILGIE